MPSKIGQIEKDKYHMISLINDKRNRNRLIDTENKLMVARWKGGWEDGCKG